MIEILFVFCFFVCFFVAFLNRENENGGIAIRIPPASARLP
jgi:hypothetical protein